MQAVVNALWAGGAEAMTLMGERVVSTSAVRCVGNTLILHGRVYSPPFVVTAVGDSEGMREALDLEPGVQLFLDYADRYGLGYAVTSSAAHPAARLRRAARAARHHRAPGRRRCPWVTPCAPWCAASARRSSPSASSCCCSASTS